MINKFKKIKLFSHLKITDLQVSWDAEYTYCSFAER